MGDWSECRLGDIVTFQRGFDITKKEQVPGAYPVVSSSGIKSYHNMYKVRSPGVVVGRKGTLGTVFFLNTDFWPHDTTLWVRNFHGNYPLLVFYFLKEFHFEQYDVGSSNPTLNRNHIHLLPSTIPPLPEQKAIASVLSSLDDKIDLLHRQNKTLEAMAETLFRQWFVEEAQEDWKNVLLGEFFPVVTGKKNANYSNEDGQYPFFTCSQGILKAPGYSFEGKAILLAGNGDFNVKRCDGKFEAYQRTYVLIPFKEKYFNFLFVLIKYFLAEITGGHQGSVINFITKGMITDFRFQIPINDFQNELTIFDRIYDKVDFNYAQIHTLEKLRDTLLPKLMGGEVRVEYEN